MAKKSRPGNSGSGKIAQLWETLMAHRGNSPDRLWVAVAPTSERKIKNDSKFRGFFDSNSSVLGRIWRGSGHRKALTFRPRSIVQNSKKKHRSWSGRRRSN